MSHRCHPVQGLDKLHIGIIGMRHRAMTGGAFRLQSELVKNLLTA